MLITGKIKLEEQRPKKKNTLKLTDLHDALLLSNSSLKNELTLTMQKYSNRTGNHSTVHR